MNTNWSRILLFSLLSFVLGWLVSHYVCSGRCGGGGCHGSGMECHGKGMCEHGGGCCSEDGKCDKEGCDHKMGGSCCKGGGHGHGGCGHGGGKCGGDCMGKCDGRCKGDCKGGSHACCKMGDGDAEAHAVIEKIKASDFEGDTTIAIEGGTVTIHKQGDDLKVQVELKDSTSVEKTVEVHTH